MSIAASTLFSSAKNGIKSEQGVTSHSGKYRMWIHSEICAWHGKNITLKHCLISSFLRSNFTRATVTFLSVVAGIWYLGNHVKPCIYREQEQNQIKIFKQEYTFGTTKSIKKKQNVSDIDKLNLKAHFVS